MKKGSLIGILSVLLLATVFWYVTQRSPVVVPAPSSVPIQASVKDKEESFLRLGFVGDIMLDRGVKLRIDKKGGGNFDFAFARSREALRSFDIVFGNLEGPISLRGEHRGSIYSFRMHPDAALALKNAGFDVLSLSNNHMGDWGMLALSDTQKYIEEQGIVAVGVGNNAREAYAPQIIERGGVRFGFVAFSDFNPYLEATQDTSGIAIASSRGKMRAAIGDARRRSDIVIVSFHFGEEYEPTPGARQRTLAELAVESGADLVIGHHPHVVQALEQYKGAYIIYSLGNFVFDQYFSPETLEAGLLVVEIKDKKIDRAILKRFKINTDFQPEVPLAEVL